VTTRAGAMDMIADDIRHRQDTVDKIEARQEQMQKALALQVQETLHKIEEDRKEQERMQLQMQAALDQLNAALPALAQLKEALPVLHDIMRARDARAGTPSADGYFGTDSQAKQRESSAEIPETSPGKENALHSSQSEGKQRATESAEMPGPCTGRGASKTAMAASTEFAQLLQELREDRHHTHSILQAILQALGGNIKAAQQHHTPVSDSSARKQAVETLHADTKKQDRQEQQGGFSTESHNKENALQRSPGEGQQRETKSAELPETPSGEGNALQSSQGEGKQRETKSAEMPQSAARLRGQKRALNKMQVTEHAQPSMPRAHIQRSMQKAEAQRNVAPSKAHPGKLANARLQRHTLTLRANSRVRKKRIVQHRMPPL